MKRERRITKASVRPETVEELRKMWEAGTSRKTASDTRVFTHSRPYVGLSTIITIFRGFEAERYGTPGVRALGGLLSNLG
jgi:hypothetical protein